MIPLWLGLAVDRLLLRCRRMGTRGCMDLYSSVYVDTVGVLRLSAGMDFRCMCRFVFIETPHVRGCIL